MSDAPQQTGPDLHAIFGIDGEPEGRTRSSPSSAPDEEIDLDALGDGRRDDGRGRRSEVDAGGRRRRGRRATPPAAPPGEARRGSASTKPVAPRLLAALPDRRDRRDGARLARAGRRRARELAHLRHDARAGAARERRAHPGRARARARRALRPRPPRPRRLPGRHVGREPRQHRGRQALPGGARRLRRQAHAAGRDGRPVERARGRRHRDHDRLRGPRRGRAAR